MKIQEVEMMTMSLSKISNYWFVIYAGVYFILASIYMNFGSAYSVNWNVYIKLVNYLYLPLIPIITLAYKHLNNTTSILFSIGLISYLCGMAIFRIIASLKSDGSFEAYFDYMKSDTIGLYITFTIFMILIVIKYLNKNG